MVQCMICVSWTPTPVAPSSHTLLDYKYKDTTRTHIFTIILKRKAQKKLKFQPTHTLSWHRCPYSHHLLVLYMLLLLVVSLIPSLRLYQSLCLSLTPTISTGAPQSHWQSGNQKHHFSQSLCNFYFCFFLKSFLYFGGKTPHCGDFFTLSFSREVNSIIWNNNKGYYLHYAFGENNAVVVKVVKAIL